MWSVPESMPRVLIDAILAGGSVVLTPSGPEIRVPLRYRVKMAPMRERLLAWVAEHRFEAPAEEDLRSWREEQVVLGSHMNAPGGASWGEHQALEDLTTRLWRGTPPLTPAAVLSPGSAAC